MIPTPDGISRYLQEQIRGAALNLPGDERRKWYHRPVGVVRWIWRWLGRDWIRSVLYAVVGVATSWAAVVLVGSWPVGGGDSVSQASIALGSTLIFVVIITGLLAGPLEAGRRVDDASWIAGDGALWGGLGTVSAVSLMIVWIGSSQPERSEEIATFLLASGAIAITGLAARRVIRLSDPRVVLQRKQKQALSQVHEVVALRAEMSRGALERAQVDAGLADDIIGVPDRVAQAAIAGQVQYPLGVARGAWQRGEHDLALWAYYEAAVLVREYARAAGRLAISDAVLRAFHDETLDLHEMSAGPAGRRFSAGLTSVFTDVGVIIVASGKGIGPSGDESLGHGFALGLETLVRSRIGDRRTTDVAAGITGIERIVHAVIDAGDDWTASYVAKPILRFAVASVGVQFGEIGIPAWQASLRILERLASSGARRSRAFNAFADDLVDAVAAVPELPLVQAHDTGFEALLGPYLGEKRLISTGQTIWLAAPPELLDDVVRFSWRIVSALRSLVDRTADDHTASVRTPEVAETAYQFLVGAVQRLDQDPASRPSREALEQLAPNTLYVTRTLLAPSEDAAALRGLDHRKLLRIHLSVWQMVIFALRTEDAPPAWVSDEIDVLATVAPDADELLSSPLLARGMRELADWLHLVGWSDEAEKVRAAAEALPDRRSRDIFGSDEDWGLGLGRDFRIYSGSMLGSLYGRVSDFFRAGLDSD